MNLKELKVVFMGTPEFSLKVLEMLINKTNVIGVVTQPDKVVGKNKEKSFTPVKQLALKYQIPVFQPEKIRKEYKDILACNPDMIVTCAYGQIIPQDILDYPKYGCINVHASLLPKLRGGSPLDHALIDGYDKTGVTIMYMDKGMDTGDIITQEEIIINDSDNVLVIHDKLSVLGSELLEKTLPILVSDHVPRIKQDDSLATYCHNITHEEELLDFHKDVRDLFNQIRGMNPYPVSYFTLDNKIYKVYEANYEKTNKFHDKEIGEVVEEDKNNLGIKANDGVIYLLDIKKEGKKRMKIKDFLNGEQTSLIGKIVNK